MNDKMHSIEALKEKVARFCDERDWGQFHDPKELAIGLVTESSELLELFRFLSKDETLDLLKCPEKSEMISDELADVLFMILRFSGFWGIDLSESLIKKLEKNEKKYPVGLCKGKNKKYTEYQSGQDGDLQ